MIAEDQAVSTFALRPLPPAAFIGRRDEVTEFLRRASGVHAPLLNLVGPSKIGRTSFLQFVQYLSRDPDRANSQCHAYLGRGSRIVLPYVDLGARPVDARIAATIAKAIAEEMRKHGLQTPRDPELERAAALEILAHHMKEQAARYVLLVDRGERLLADDARLADDDWASGAIQVLGSLNEYVPEFGLTLAFGVSGAFREVDAQTRQAREQRFLQMVSSLFNLMVERIELRLLQTSAVEEFSRSASLPQADGGWSRLTDREVAWVVRVAGRHPFVLQQAGLMLGELRSDGVSPDDVRFDQLEQRLAKKLLIFVGAAVTRLASRKGALAVATQVATSERGDDVARDLGEALAGEGLADVDSAGDAPLARCRIPSPVVRASLLAVIGEQPLHVLPPSSLSVESPDAKVNVVRLTATELKLMQRLLDAAPDELVPREELLEALGPQTTLTNLAQRLSVLRDKIRDVAGGRDPFENVYGRGYRLVEPGSFKLNP